MIFKTENVHFQRFIYKKWGLNKAKLNNILNFFRTPKPPKFKLSQAHSRLKITFYLISHRV